MSIFTQLFCLRKTLWKGNVNIPGRYLSPEETETFPLKRSFYDSAQSFSHGCCSCCSSDDGGFGNLNSIYSCLFILSLAVSIALAVQIHYGNFELEPHGSVASDSYECSVIGTDILKRGGNAVDAAIATTFCLGVVNMHITGLGSGGIMMIYSHRQQRVLDMIDFREITPSQWDSSLSAVGATVGVPGLLRGLGLAHRLYGKISWKELVMPSANLAKNGFRVSHAIIDSMHFMKNDTKDNLDLRTLFNSLKLEENFTFSALADTLEDVALEGPDAIYNGTLSLDIIETVKKAGGVMTLEDLSSYQADQHSTIKFHFSNFSIFAPETSGGLYLKSVLETLENSSVNFWENFDGSYLLTTMSGAFKNIPEFSGDVSTEFVGSQVSAVDINDIYVSVISGLNTWLGSQLLTNRGYILNSAMLKNGKNESDFSVKKRPLSFYLPAIAVDKKEICGLRFVFGCGDATIATQLILRLLYNGDNITASVEAPRFQMTANSKLLGLEDDRSIKFSVRMKENFKNIGYTFYNVSKPYQSCNVIQKIHDNLMYHSDSRGDGVASGF